jgi:glutamyl-tRNA reductase
MPNDLFNQFGNQPSQANTNITQQFNQFMQQMRGQDPNAIINQLMASGRVNQQQINQAHQRAREMEKQFEGLKKNYGF